MLRVTLTIAAAFVAALGARSRDGSRAPATVAGTWQYEIPALKVQDGDKVTTCVVKGATFVLKQSGSTLTGNSFGGTFLCGNEPPHPGNWAPIDSGVVRGDSVIFWLATLVHRGRVVGDTIRGQMAGKTDVPMSGAFRMTKRK